VTQITVFDWMLVLHKFNYPLLTGKKINEASTFTSKCSKYNTQRVLVVLEIIMHTFHHPPVQNQIML